MKKILPMFLAAVLAQAGADSLHAGYLDDIGYTALVSELDAAGTPVPDGEGVKVTIVEAPVSITGTAPNQVYAYVPSGTNFTGVTLTNKSAATYTGTSSWHATMVASAIYGNSSMGSGVTTADLYYYVDWLESGYLRFNTPGSAPRVETSDVANHSWVGTTGNALSDAAILNRLDYSIQRDDYVAVVGINNNDSGTATAQNLLASAYNTLSVGRSDGVHVSGTSTTVNTGVTFPRVVAPVPTTSEATAIVSGASVFLISTARSGTGVVDNTSVNGDKSETIKAVILAGATKSQFPTWSNSATQPLDSVYGAGQVNVDNSYHIMVAGEQHVSSGYTDLVEATGWDFSTINIAGVSSYYFDIASETPLSIALTWNAIFSPISGNYDNMSLYLADLNLFLYQVGPGGILGSLVASSTAVADNVEYIWAEALAAGSYVVQVSYLANTSGAGTSIDYGVAWQSAAVPEPGTVGLMAVAVLVLGGVAWRRRRV